MLEPILQGFIEWLYTIFVDTADYVFGDLMDVLTMDMTYFRKVAPVVTDIAAIIRALGWAMLIGNLVFQALKSMMSGAGFEGEDPRLLFTRTFAFSFLLLASDQICEICMQMTRRVVTLLSMPATFKMTLPTEAHFIGFACNWMLVAIVGIILIIQLVKLFVDIGERYVITCVLTFMAPLAFAMGGSRNTSDIFKGWCRMYGSMNLMLIMNIVFLKLIISAMSHMVSSGVILWVVFIVALTRVARKIDAHIAKIGLNPAQAGNSLGVRLPGAMTMVVVKSLASMVGKSAGAARNGASGSHSGGNPPPNGYRGRGTNPTPPPSGGNPVAEADVNVNVNSQSRGARVNVPGSSASTVHSGNQFNANSQFFSANSSPRSESASYDNSGSSNPSRVQNQTQNAPRASNPSRPPLSRNTAGISQTSVQTNTTTTSQGHSQQNSPVNPPRAAATPPSAPSTGNVSQEHHHSSQQNASSTANVNPAVRNSTPANPAVSQSYSTVATSEMRSGSTVSTQTPPAHPQVNVASSGNDTSVNPVNTSYHSTANTPLNRAGASVNVQTAPNGNRNTTVPIVSVPTTGSPVGGGNNTVVSTQSVSNSALKGDSNVNGGDATSSTVMDGSNTNTVNTRHIHNNTTPAAPVGINGSHVNITHSPTTSNIETIGGAASHNTSITASQQRIDHTHQHGRHDPAAANRKGHRYYFTKTTETTKLNREQPKRGEKHGETAAERRQGRGGSQRTDA